MKFSYQLLGFSLLVFFLSACQKEEIIVPQNYLQVEDQVLQLEEGIFLHHKSDGSMMVSLVDKDGWWQGNSINIELQQATFDNRTEGTYKIQNTYQYLNLLEQVALPENSHEYANIVMWLKKDNHFETYFSVEGTLRFKKHQHETEFILDVELKGGNLKNDESCINTTKKVKVHFKSELQAPTNGEWWTEKKK